MSIKCTEQTFPSSDGVNNIHWQLWEPSGEVRAVVQLVHGVSEHIGRYDAFARHLAEHGFAAAGDDHLGHGLTARDASDLGFFAEEDGWDKIISDEKTLHDLLRERYPDVPMILLGHSMGSFMARTYLGRYPEDFDRCVLSGTGHTPALVCALGRRIAQGEIRRHGARYHSQKLQKMAFGSYLRGIENPLGVNDWICRDEAVIRAYDDDPLCGAPASAELMAEMMRGLSLIRRREHLSRMRRDMPVLFIAGEADPVGGWGKGARKVERMFRAAGMEDVTAIYYPEMRHEVLNELGKEQVWDDVLRWLEKGA